LNTVQKPKAKRGGVAPERRATEGIDAAKNARACNVGARLTEAGNLLIAQVAFYAARGTLSARFPALKRIRCSAAPTPAGSAPWWLRRRDAVCSHRRDHAAAIAGANKMLESTAFMSMTPQSPMVTLSSFAMISRQRRTPLSPIAPKP
jgi:hypothetical protein